LRLASYTVCVHKFYQSCIRSTKDLQACQHQPQKRMHTVEHNPNAFQPTASHPSPHHLYATNTSASVPTSTTKTYAHSRTQPTRISTHCLSPEPTPLVCHTHICERANTNHKDVRTHLHIQRASLELHGIQERELMMTCNCCRST